MRVPPAGRVRRGGRKSEVRWYCARVLVRKVLDEE